MDMPLPVAEFISYWANWILFGALVLGVLATYGIVVSGTIKEAALKLALSQSAERTGILEKDAELLRKENLRLEAQLSPRKLRPDQMQAIATALLPFKGKTIRVESYALDVESAFLANQIMDTLGAAQVVVDNNILSKSPLGSLDLGVRVTGDDKALVDALLATLSDAGKLLALPNPPTPTAGISLGNSGGKVDAEIFVGARPPQP